MKLTNLAIASLTTLFLVGCGNSDSNTNVSLTSSLDLPDGKTLIFFDNESSKQYMYDTTEDTNTDMNSEANATYNMTDKTGKIIRWDHETTAGVDQKIVMLTDDFDINEGNLTFNDFHYLGHFHEEDNEHVFAAHSNSEFDPEVSSDGKKAALVSLNQHLLQQEEIKQEISEALPSTEELCNFYAFEHEEHDENTTDTNTTEEHAHEGGAHIALTKSGQVYVYYEEDGEEGLHQDGTAFALDGVSSCEEDQSSIMKASDYGVYIFSAQSQTLYLVDSHGEDFHQHSKWTGSKFLPTNFTPTQFAGISESDEEDHDH
jgi:major membrane immunogen (membrane-anchored lipoprotein)